MPCPSTPWWLTRYLMFQQKFRNAEVYFNVWSSNRVGWRSLALSTEKLWRSASLDTSADFRHDGGRDQLPRQLPESLFTGKPSLPHPHVYNIYCICPTGTNSACEPFGELVFVSIHLKKKKAFRQDCDFWDFYPLVGRHDLDVVKLFNLQIGLAVGDIAKVQKNATLKQIAMQVCRSFFYNQLKRIL